MSSNTYLLGILCYNCEKQIGRVLNPLSKEMAGRFEKILLIDNGSTDKSIEIATAIIKEKGIENFAVARNDENYGIGGSHKVAFLQGLEHGTDYVVILHGDNQVQTEEVIGLLDVIEASPQDAAVLGSRFMPGSRLVNYSTLRTAGNIALNWLFTFVTGHRTLDLGSGLNAFRVRDLKDKKFLAFNDDGTVNHDILLHYFKENASVKFYPISWTVDDQESSVQAFEIGFDCLVRLLRWRLGLETHLPPARIRAYTATISAVAR